MGVKLLNSFLLKRCKHLLKEKHLSSLKGTSVAVDILIYIYKFKKEGGLYEKIIKMVNLFMKYKITPVFIFDGYYGEEKKEEQKKRSDEKKKAEKKIIELKENLEKRKETITKEEKDDIEEEIVSLKKKAIKIKKKEIETIKAIFMNMGVTYINAQGEADELCVYLWKQKKVDAVLSEDMDMFVYGCAKVYRYFSILNENLIVYNLHQILKYLKLTFRNFQNLTIVCGTDYNTKNKDINNFYSIYANRFNLFKNVFKNKEEMNKINDVRKYFMFQNEKLNQFDNMIIMNSPMNKECLKELLTGKGFYFV